MTKKLTLLLVSLFFIQALGAQVAVEPVVTSEPAPAVESPKPVDVGEAVEPAVFTSKTQYYEITSYVSQEQADETGLIMEALLSKYNSFFLQDLTKLTLPLKVTWFKEKAQFDSFLANKVSAPRADFAYLSYKDKSKSLLAAFDGIENPIPSLAFQGFVQYLWTFFPQPPVWLRNGFGYYFWDLVWNKNTQKLESSGSLAFLDSSKKLLGAGAPDITDLLTMEDKRDGTAADSQRDYLSWSLVYFLVNSENPLYNRLLGNVMANLSPTATLEENSKSILKRIAGVKDLKDLQNDLVAYITGVKGFNDYMQDGIGFYRSFLTAKKSLDPTSSNLLVQSQQLFDGAQKVRPKDFRPLYYKGLLAYGDGNYSLAETRFSESASLGSQNPGLLPYALGLSTFYQKKFDLAKTYLAQAKLENPEEYGPNVDIVMGMME